MVSLTVRLHDLLSERGVEYKETPVTVYEPTCCSPGHNRPRGHLRLSQRQHSPRGFVPQIANDPFQEAPDPPEDGGPDCIPPALEPTLALLPALGTTIGGPCREEESGVPWAETSRTCQRLPKITGVPEQRGDHSENRDCMRQSTRHLTIIGKDLGAWMVRAPGR